VKAIRQPNPPAALLAETALLAGDDDAWALGVGLADAVLPVVLLGAGELQPAALDLAPHLPSSALLALGTLPLPLLPAAPRRRLAGGARGRRDGAAPVPEERRRGGRRGRLRDHPLHGGFGLVNSRFGDRREGEE
jgi:hypothetical protein